MLGAEASTRNPRLELKQSLNRKNMSRSAFVLGCWFALGFSNYGRVSCELQDADMQTNRGPCEATWANKVSRYESYVQALERLEDSRGPHMEQWNGKRAYDMYEPEWTCESEVRVGPNEVNVGDGPKFVCGIETLKYEPECLVYSIGSNYNFQFEMGVRKYAENCEFHVFDGTMNLAKRPLPQDLSEKGIQFHNWNVQATTEIGGKGYPSRGLEDILRDLNHVGKTIHIFKIDCEGCEYKVLASLAKMVLKGTVKVGQIQVEVHGTNAMQIQELFRNLRHAGFMIFHKERNHWGCQGYSCVEYAMIGLNTAEEVYKQSHCDQVQKPRMETSDLKTVDCHGVDKNFIEKLNMQPCRKLGFSQGNQDCMLDTIFKNLGTTNRFYVEFGFNTRRQCSGSGPNTCKLWHDGWKGLLLDGQNYNSSINLHAHFLYHSNIKKILQSYSVPYNVDFLSCDMDSHDYFVLSAILESFRPRVVTTEYNSNWPLEWTMSQIDPSLSEELLVKSNNSFKFRQCIWGASVSALKQLMERHGYVMIGVTPLLDLFWANAELLSCYNIPDFSQFLGRMRLGKLHHRKQTDMQYREWLVDTSSLSETGDLEHAREVARTKIEVMIKSGQPLPCFSGIKLPS